jgi:hypothetical protein
MTAWDISASLPGDTVELAEFFTQRLEAASKTVVNALRIENVRILRPE